MMTNLKDDMEIKGIEGLSKQLCERTSALLITDQVSYDRSYDYLKAIKEFLSRVDDVFGKIWRAQKEAADLTRKEWVDAKAPAQLEFDRIKKEAGNFIAEKERLAKIEEGKRLKAQQEKDEAEKKLKAAQEKAVVKIEKAEIKGDEKKVEEIAQAFAKTDVRLNEKIERADAVLAKPEPERIEKRGIRQRTDWKVSVFAADNVPEEYLKPREVDKAKVLRVVRAHQGKITIPGINIEEVRVDALY